MRKTIAATIIVAALATTTYAREQRSFEPRQDEPSTIARVVRFVQHLFGIRGNADLVIPKP